MNCSSKWKKEVDPVCRLRLSAHRFAASGLALALLLAGATPAWAAPSFPRGGGFYYNPYKIAGFLAAYLTWACTCGWVSRDLGKLERDPVRWNTCFLGAGLVGILAVWVFPVFWLAWIAFLAGYLAMLAWYVSFRNALVAPDRRVFTLAHLQSLLPRTLRFHLPQHLDDLEEEERPVVHFRNRTRTDGDDDDDRQVPRSKGYRAAQDLILDAFQHRASEIHLQPGMESMAVRFIVNGAASDREPLGIGVGQALVNALKTLANLDVAQRRLPQDGFLTAHIGVQTVEIRLAAAGNDAGDRTVLRLLDADRKMLTLGQLGMRDKMRDQLLSLLKQPHGLILACGPAGAGKTSSLYACLNELDRYQQKIVTVESPIELRLDNVTQIEVDARAGKTHAAEIHDALRQNPNVLLIGAIRDGDTAQLACRLAESRCLVFSTLEVSDCTSAISRLIELNVDPFLIAGALTGVLSQRLVRHLCPDCKVRFTPDAELLKKGFLSADKVKFLYRRPSPEQRAGNKFCATCRNTGYHGRSGIFELLVVGDTIRKLIKENPDPAALKHAATNHGMRHRYEDGLRLVIAGQTSLTELVRASKC